jgi:hypothetical protein
MVITWIDRLRSLEECFGNGVIDDAAALLAKVCIIMFTYAHDLRAVSLMERLLSWLHVSLVQ